MDATANFSLRFARASDSEVEATGGLLSRQVLQRIAIRMSLVCEAIGFSVFGILDHSEPASGRPETVLAVAVPL
jgi:hypothetical protein